MNGYVYHFCGGNRYFVQSQSNGALKAHISIYGMAQGRLMDNDRRKGVAIHERTTVSRVSRLAVAADRKTLCYLCHSASRREPFLVQQDLPLGKVHAVQWPTMKKFRFSCEDSDDRDFTNDIVFDSSTDRVIQCGDNELNYFCYDEYLPTEWPVVALDLSNDSRLAYITTADDDESSFNIHVVRTALPPFRPIVIRDHNSDDLWKNRSLRSDLTFSVDGVKLATHRFILETRSEYFRKALNSGCIESSGSRNEEQVVVIPDATPKVFEAYLYFIYTHRQLDDLSFRD